MRFSRLGGLLRDDSPGSCVDNLELHRCAVDASTLAQLVGRPFAVSTGILAVASFWQVRTSHAMTLIINEWSGNLLRGQSSAWHLKGAWRLISGLFRKTSRTFQSCYAALCATIVLVAFTAINDARRELVLFSLPNLATVLVILASTTGRRLPSLVTLVEPNAQQESDLMELTLFLSFSECGFFVWDTSVTVGLVQKFLYFTLMHRLRSGGTAFSPGSLSSLSFSDPG
ncbi:unnamed protein product [Effrenium voratum]|nr:unnamed protein product [Effrenium voratum]